MKDFSKITNFLVSYNNICKYSEVTWEIIDDRMYIDGNPNQLGTIFSLLWSTTEDYNLYFTYRNHTSMIEVLSMKEKEGRE